MDSVGGVGWCGVVWCDGVRCALANMHYSILRLWLVSPLTNLLCL